MNISWGTKIAMLYGGFVIMILSLVAATTFKKPVLVADDYYQQEVNFQQRLDAAKAAADLEQQVRVAQNAAGLTLQFPEAFAGKSITGTAHFYAPANAAADRSIELNGTDQSFSIARSSLAAANYELQLSFTVSGKAYYQSIPLNLQ